MLTVLKSKISRIVAGCGLLMLSATAAPEGELAGTATGFVKEARSIAELVELDILDNDTFEVMSDVLDDGQEVVWRLYVPESYDPKKPAGLFVYISPTRQGFMPRGWRTVFDESNLIWASADDSGNDVAPVLRMFYALAATNIVADEYQIDTDRIYLGGFSGGGKMASMVSVHFADLFRGGMFIGGANYWKSEPELIDHVRNNRYVFVAGAHDFNLDLTKRTHGRFRRAGVESTKLEVVRNMGHDTPPVGIFRETINFLDGETESD